MVKSILSLLILILVFPWYAFGAISSDTVPTSQLMAIFSVEPSFTNAGQTTASVTLAKVEAINGLIATETLAQSADEVITFDQGGSSLVYNPADPSGNVLPNVVGQTYSLSFKRFNGETYSNSAVMPNLPTISEPSPNQVFKKTDTVNIAWTSVPAQGKAFAIQTNCREADLAQVTVNSSGTQAVVPAGAIAKCTGPVQMTFYPIYYNSGTGFGSFAATAYNAVSFSYGASVGATTPPELSGFRLHQLIHEAVFTPGHLVLIGN